MRGHETARREVQTIVREATRAATIVRNLLVFGGARSHVRRPVSLTAVLRKVLADMNPVEAVELLTTQIKRFKTNEEFLKSLGG